VTHTQPRFERIGFLAKSSLIATLLLVAVGGFTRGSGSGYGCSDRWPLCEGGVLGGLLPRWEYNMIIEWSHRWLAAVVGILVVATAISAWRRARRRLWVVVPATLAVVIVFLQAWVGRLVVKGQLAGDLVTLHLAISMLVVMLLTVLVVNTAPPDSVPVNRRESRRWVVLVGVAAGGSFVLLLLGSAVRNLYFPGWPLMLVPDLSDASTVIHFLHRSLAGVLGVYLIFLTMWAYRIGLSLVERRLAVAASALFLVNVGVGAAHVVTQVSSALLVAMHLALGALVWSVLVAATTMATRGRQASMTEAPDTSLRT